MRHTVVSDEDNDVEEGQNKILEGFDGPGTTRKHFSIAPPDFS